MVLFSFMKYIFLIAALLIFGACNDNTTSTAPNGSVHAGATDTITTHQTPFVLTGCYEMTLKRDSAFLDLQVKDTVVTGTLQFQFFEKDNNTGTLQGVLRNDMIIADYTFRSEGVTSVREVVFKIKEGTLLSAHGTMVEKDGKLVFTDKEALQYQTQNPYIKVDCPAP